MRSSIIFAKLLSFVFHPVIFFLFMPYLVVYKQTGDVWASLRWTIFSAFFVLLGLLVVLVGKTRGTFSDIDVSNRKERAKFYLAMWPLFICYVVASFLFRGAFFYLTIISVGIIFGLFLFEVINLKVKASLHIGVVVAFVLAIGLLYGWYYFWLVIGIIPLLIWSRLTLKRHTRQEVFTGGVLGIIITGVTFFMARLIFHL